MKGINMYYITFIIGMVLSVVNVNKRKALILFTIIISVLSFLRYGVGPDYFSYNYLYERLNNSLFMEIRYGIDNQELMFRLIGALIKKIGFSYQQYIIIIAAINIIYIYKICKKYSRFPTLSLFLYYCFYYFVWTFSGLRQGLTLPIGVYYLLECIENNQTKKIVLISLLLTLLHSSAIILIPLYFISRLNFNRKKLIVLSLISIMINLIPLEDIISKLIWIPQINRILHYLNGSTTIFDFKSFARLIFLLIGLVYYNSYSNLKGISKNIIVIYIISIIMYFSLKFSELTAARISIYGMFLNILILPNIYYMYKDKFNKFIYILCLFILCSMYFNKELNAIRVQFTPNNSYSSFVQYTNIYNKDNYHFNNRYIDYLENK